MPAGGTGAELAQRRSTAAGGEPRWWWSAGRRSAPEAGGSRKRIFCGARHARSVDGWQHPSAWRGPRPRRLPALHSEREWLFVRVAFRELGFGKTRARRRRESEIAYAMRLRAKKRSAACKLGPFSP